MEGRLYLIVYSGVEHYYFRQLENVERIIASIEISPPARVHDKREHETRC